jgi:adenosine deaminase
LGDFSEVQLVTWHDLVPKVELHVHLEGSIPLAALFNLVQKYGGDPQVPDLMALEQRFQYRDFTQFIKTWSWKNQFLREYEDFTYIGEVFAASLAAQSIRYAEMFFSPSPFVKRGLDLQNLLEAVRIGLDRVSGTKISIIIDFVRDYGQASELKILSQLSEVKNLGIIGIGIGGSEHEFPPCLFKNLFRKAKALGFHTTAHAGEASGAGSIHEAIHGLGAERIGHGVRACEDPELVEYLAFHQIALEMCPMSNVRTGIVPGLAEHPISRYFQAGIPVTVNTDDPAMFQTSLAQEYQLLEQHCGWSRDAIRQIIVNGIENSWLSSERKKSLKSEFIADPAWI